MLAVMYPSALRDMPFSPRISFPLPERAAALSAMSDTPNAKWYGPGPKVFRYSPMAESGSNGSVNSTLVWPTL